MSEQKQPKVRFSEFDDDWEQHKLGEVFSERLDRTSTGELISVTINNGVVKSDSLNRKDNSSQNKSNYKKVNRNDIAYNSMRMWQGASGVSQYEGILSPAYTVLIPNQVSSVFFSFYFKKEHMKQTFQKYSQGLTSDTWNLKYPQLKLIHVLVPAIKEQNKIANLLSKLDSRIAANQRQLEELKTIKKLAMQKIFDQEWRFNGFTDAWEPRKLGNVAIIKGRLGWKSLKQDEYTTNKEDPAMIAGRHINFGQINWNAVDHIPMWRYKESLEIALQDGDVIFSKDGSLGNPALIKALDGKATINSTMMLVRTNNTIYSDFFYQLMKGKQFKKLVYLKVSGSSIPHLFQDDMKKFVFSTPDIREQKRIGLFLGKLDNLIAANQSKSEQLKKLKKWFMQNMFM